MIRKTTIFAELLADCPYIQLSAYSPITTAMWLEARLAEREIQLSSAPRDVEVETTHDEQKEIEEKIERLDEEMRQLEKSIAEQKGWIEGYKQGAVHRTHLLTPFSGK